MAYGAAESAIRGAIDRWAKIRQTYQITTGTDFWARVDASGDETYENRVKGTAMTALDAALADGNIGDNSAFSPWFSLHRDYLITDVGKEGLDDWLTDTARWRVPEEFANCHYEWEGNRLTAANIAPSNLTDFGRYTQSGDVWLADQSVSANGSLGRVRAVVITKGTADLVMTCTCYFAAAGILTVTPQVTIPASSPPATEVLLGVVTPSNNEAAGQVDIELGAGSTAPFKATYPVLIYDDNAQEIGVVSSVVDNTKIVLSTGLRHSYLLANNLRVQALYHHITAVTATGGHSSDVIDLLVHPDRPIAL